MAGILGNFDFSCCLALIAHENSFCRPVVTMDFDFDVSWGRHVTVEGIQRGSVFVPNDCCLNRERSIWLVTGANMGGKSTFLRQNGLIAILSQIGSYVPAKSAHIGIVDAVFSRVGASDDLSRNRSTFMVEMLETAAILNRATPKSLVIMDEIGRGTATADGLAIAQAVIEHLHNYNQCRTLFATHFHELTNLETVLPRLKCYHLAIQDPENRPIFVHKVVSGVAQQSYGIQVAKLAGLEPSVIARASDILQQQKKISQQHGKQEVLVIESQIEKELEKIDIKNITAREAIGVLTQLKSLLTKTETKVIKSQTIS